MVTLPVKGNDRNVGKTSARVLTQVALGQEDLWGPWAGVFPAHSGWCGCEDSLDTEPFPRGDWSKEVTGRDQAFL